MFVIYSPCACGVPKPVIKSFCAHGQCNLCPGVATNNSHQQQHCCPGGSYCMGPADDEVFELQQDVSMDDKKSDYSYSHSEWMSYEETGGDYNNDIRSDQQAVYTCEQCSKHGKHELVIPKSHSGQSLSTDNSQTTVCRYCREEVKNFYYDHHLLRCSEDYGTSCEKYSQQWKIERECETDRELQAMENNVHQFIVNCTAVQASN